MTPVELKERIEDVFCDLPAAMPGVTASPRTIESNLGNLRQAYALASDAAREVDRHAAEEKVAVAMRYLDRVEPFHPDPAGC